MNLLETTQQQTSFNVLLIGDSCIDRYFIGTCDRLSPEAPVPVVDFDNETNHIYASYTPTKRELHMDREIYKTLDNYLGEDAATYVIDWFNSEFDTDAEHVTF